MALLDKGKRRQEYIDAICKDYPDIRGDKLKMYYVEEMVNAYLADETHFKKVTQKCKQENAEVFRQPKTEVVGITKIDAPKVEIEDITENVSM